MNYYEGDNVGSLLKVEFIEHYNLASFNPSVPGPGFDWTDVPLKEQSGVLKVKIEDTDNGKVYTYSGKWNIHNMRDDVDAVMINLVGQISVLRLTDMNGRIYIIGAPGIPVTITINQDTGEKYINENGTEFLFTVEQPFAALKA